MSDQRSNPNQPELPWRDAYYFGARASDLRDRVNNAIRRLGSTKVAAHQLDQIFGPSGRGVGESTLRAAMNESERNYFRLEWIVLVDRDEEVRSFFAKPALSPEEENRAMRDFIATNAPGLVPGMLRALGRTT